MLERRIQFCKGVLYGNSVTAYWYSNVVNFGDRLTPVLLEHYGFTPIHDRADRAQLLVLGSLLQGVPEDYSGNILGTGLIRDERRSFNYAKIWAVRGELTRDRIGAPSGTPLGDPGLLSSHLISSRMPKSYALGIVPHYIDKNDVRVVAIARRLGHNVKLIDVQRAPVKVLKDIDRCESILSSSLHGVIAADALNIPNAWIQLSDRVTGGGFKFYDYATAIGRNIRPVRLDGRETLKDLTAYAAEPPEAIDTVKRRLDRLFKSVKEYFESETQTSS